MTRPDSPTHSASPREFSGLDDESVRRQVLSEECPAVMRGLVDHWDAVREARVSPDALLRYLRQFDAGKPVDALLMRPEFEGQLSYNDAMTGFNFVRNRLPLSEIAAQVLRYAKFPNSPSVAAQSALIRDCLPGFEEHNRLGALPAAVQARIWLGNRISTPAHVDEWSNIGCVVAGRRRFILFPPDQISNLYIGPLDFAPTGAAMSLVSHRAPDLERFPKFPAALDSAQIADLGPGDAIFIPPLWWHRVESLDSFNVLVNYWWRVGDAPEEVGDSAFDALLHGILSIRKLPPASRRAWAAFFEHYVFGARDQAIGHIPALRHGILGDLTPTQSAALREHLASRLTELLHKS